MIKTVLIPFDGFIKDSPEWLDKLKLEERMKIGL
jgi:hypothetical protein